MEKRGLYFVDGNGHGKMPRIWWEYGIANGYVGLVVKMPSSAGCAHRTQADADGKLEYRRVKGVDSVETFWISWSFQLADVDDV